MKIESGWLLLALALVYAAASLFHFAHNAEFLADYPNMPAWITSAGVYGAWLGISAVGLGALFLIRRGNRTAGLALLVIYGSLGLDGFAHYSLAPMSAHNPAMNSSIWLEAVTGALLAMTAIGAMLKRA